MKRLGQHLDTAVGSYNKAGKELQKIDKDVVKLTAGDAKIEIDEVERPTLDD
jgi:ribosomal protein S3